MTSGWSQYTDSWVINRSWTQAFN